jgi:hypothetical protein
MAKYVAICCPYLDPSVIAFEQQGRTSVKKSNIECRFWDFGVLKVIQELLNDPENARDLQQRLDHVDPASIFSSKGFQRFNERMGGNLGADRDPQLPVVLYLLVGADGVRLTTFTVGTAFIICVKLLNLSCRLSDRKTGYRPLIVV